MIQAGKLLFQGHVSELLAAQAGQLLARPERADQLEPLAALIRAAGHIVHINDDTLAVAADGTWAAQLNRLAMQAGITLVHLSEHRATLEEAFFHLVGTDTGDIGDRLTKVEAP